MYFRSHPFADFNVPLERLIVVQSGRKLMCSKWDVSEAVGRPLRGFSVQKNGGTGWITLHRKLGDFLTRNEFQRNFWSHPFADFNVPLERLIVVQSGRKLMCSKWDVSEAVGRSLRGFSVQKNGGTRWITLHRKFGDFLTRNEFQRNFWSHPFADFNVPLERLIVVQSGRKLMYSKWDVSEAVGRPLRGFSVQKNDGTRWITLH